MQFPWGYQGQATAMLVGKSVNWRGGVGDEREEEKFPPNIVNHEAVENPPETSQLD